MANITYTSHPRVTIEHRSAGPVVVHDRRGPPEDVRRGRFWTVLAGVVGLAFLGVMLLMSWRAGELDGTDVRNAALAGGLLVVVVGYFVVVGWGRVEIEAIGNRLQIRAWPFDVDYGGSVDINRIDHLQVERDVELGRDKYRVQIVGRDGFGLLPPWRALSDINTQDEATGLAGAIAQQFGLRSITGVHRAAEYSPELDEEILKSGNPHNSKDYLDFLPVTLVPGITDGKIRVKRSGTGTVVSFTPGLDTRVGWVSFSILWFFCIGAFTANILRGSESGLGLIAMLAFVSIFWGVGFFMLGQALTHKEIHREGHQLVCDTRLGSVRVTSQKIPTAELARVGVEVYWDSYNKMHHKFVAHMKTGDDVSILGSVSEADGHALCQALHKYLGVPV